VTPEPSLDELLAEVRAEAAVAIAAMDAERAGLEQEARAERAARDAAVEQFAERARSGELGPEQRRLQERFDLGESSWDAVISGADSSPEAGAVRLQVDRNAAEASDALAQAIEEGRLAGRPDPRAEAFDSFAELRALVADVVAEHGGGVARGQ
jgi:hypothetical protein